MAIGLFGSKKKPMFGNPAERYGTPGIGDGLPGNQPQPQSMGDFPPMGQGAPVNQPGQKAGLGTRLFGKGWENKAFALGGIMQGDPTGAYMMRQDERAQQEAAQAARMAELKRAQDIADFETKEGIRARYETRKPYRFEANDGDVYELGADGQPVKVFDDPSPRMQMVMGPDGRPYFMNPNGQGAAPTAPVGKLTPISGGPSQPATGGF